MLKKFYIVSAPKDNLKVMQSWYELISGNDRTGENVTLDHCRGKDACLQFNWI